MHILPNSKIPFSSIPLDVMISNKSAYIKQVQEKAYEEAKKEAQANPQSQGK